MPTRSPLQIHTRKTAGAAKLLKEPDDYNSFIEVLLKLVPAEVVAAYLTIQGIIGSCDKDAPQSGTLLFVSAALLFCATPLVLVKLRKVTLPSQIIITTLGFAVWLFATADPLFSYIGGWWYGPERERTAAVVLVLFVFGMPLFYKSSPPANQA